LEQEKEENNDCVLQKQRVSEERNNSIVNPGLYIIYQAHARVGPVWSMIEGWGRSARVQQGLAQAGVSKLRNEFGASQSLTSTRVSCPGLRLLFWPFILGFRLGTLSFIVCNTSTPL